MNQQEYIQSINEMIIPASKIKVWANIIKQEYYGQYDNANRELFDRMVTAVLKLEELLSNLQHTEYSGGADVFTHTIGGPIMTMQGSAKIILSDYKKSKESSAESEHFRYLEKINNAAEYLASLDRDAVLQITLGRLNNKGKT